MVHLEWLALLVLTLEGGILLREEVLAVLDGLELRFQLVALQGGGRDLLGDGLVLLVLAAGRVVPYALVLGLRLRLLLDLLHRRAGGLEVRVVALAGDACDVRLLLRLLLL